jgi:hypothetical protein
MVRLVIYRKYEITLVKFSTSNEVTRAVQVDNGTRTIQGLRYTLGGGIEEIIKIAVVNGLRALHHQSHNVI